MQTSTEEGANKESVVLTIEQLNREVKNLIETNLNLVWAQGEISNFKAHTSGHFYLSLKDSKSQIRAVMFRGYNSRLKFKPVDGMEVIVRGRITVYEPRGEYQINLETMEPVGAGALQKAFEQLKEKLRMEGLFEQSRKRPIPHFPRHVAIVTSPTGAVIRDMINVLSRRNRSVKITLVPTIVQGEGAAKKIVEALQLAERLSDVDTIIVGRGGGSIEDLWAFNDEELARVIVRCRVPVISAVGHEIDFTISDFVSDLRAPTPSAAAELVVKSSEDLMHRLDSLKRLIESSIEKHWQMDFQRWKGLSSRLVDPQRRLQDLAQRNDELHLRLQQAMRSEIQRRGPMLEMMHLKIKNKYLQLFENKKFRLQRSLSLLESLSPLKVVERGYSVVKKQKSLIKSIHQIQLGDAIEIQLTDGFVNANVVEIKPS